jgi:hypothetical protein
MMMIVIKTHSIDVAFPNSHNLNSTIAEKLRMYTDLKEELIRMWQLKTTYILPLVLSTMGIIPNKFNKNLELLNLHPSVYTQIQKAVILNSCCISRNFVAVNKKCLVSEICILLRTS